MTEEADSHEQLEYDDEQYSQLPGNVLDLRLYHRKAILWQYMFTVRCMSSLSADLNSVII